jgi:hypothetical protein
MLQTPSRKVTLVHGSGMGAGAARVPLPCNPISIPEVFNIAVGQDSFLRLTASSVIKHAIDTIITDNSFCKKGLCGFRHAATSPDVGMADTGADMASPDTEIVKQNAARSITYTRLQPGNLPLLRDAIPGLVPVNEARQRLDYVTQQPPYADWQAYYERFRNSEKKPCRWFHLANGCHFHDACVYDHSEISVQVHRVFQHTVRRTPCFRGSDCLLIDCIYGHICQDTSCLIDDLKAKSCSMRRFHSVVLEFASWKKGKHAPEFPTGGAIQTSDDNAEVEQAESFWF